MPMTDEEKRVFIGISWYSFDYLFAKLAQRDEAVLDAVMADHSTMNVEDLAVVVSDAVPFYFSQGTGKVLIPWERLDEKCIIK